VSARKVPGETKTANEQLLEKIFVYLATSASYKLSFFSA